MSGRKKVAEEHHSGLRDFTDDQVRTIILPELERLAEEHAVDGLPQIEAKQVIAYMRAHKDSPLWQVMPSDEEYIAAHHLEIAKRMIRSVRRVRADVPATRGDHVYVRVSDVPIYSDGGRERRGATNIRADDARKDFDLSTRVADGRLAQLRSKFLYLESWIKSTPMPGKYSKLVEGIRAELERFDTADVIRDAAE